MLYLLVALLLGYASVAMAEDSLNNLGVRLAEEKAARAVNDLTQLGQVGLLALW
jgi:hypothetical protein